MLHQSVSEPSTDTATGHRTPPRTQSSPSAHAAPTPAATVTVRTPRAAIRCGVSRL
ncbi:hypothetical protein ACF08W_11945 [Streptomyces sp. NPDC015144]|uniref:hypothetical protein n=1 Tax=Streptomyces sp. NPDC015144 TaxID=3364944 RepID=UPI0036F89F4E